MRTTYIYDGKNVVPKRVSRADRPKGPMVQGDLPGYISPCSTPDNPVWVEGRLARREDLKRNNCIEIDPGEWKGRRER